LGERVENRKIMKTEKKMMRGSAISEGVALLSAKKGSPTKTGSLENKIQRLKLT